MAKQKAKKLIMEPIYEYPAFQPHNEFLTSILFAGMSKRIDKLEKEIKRLKKSK
jgi:hypothetical protein